MSIYDVPCPTCGGRIVSSSRTSDDDQAPTSCERGHQFMRSEALKKAQAFTETLRPDLGQGPVVVNAARRLKAYDKTWIKKEEQHRQAHPRHQGQQKPAQLDNRIFNMQPSQLSQNLKDVYKDDYAGAAGALNLFKNRMGKNLPSPDRDRLDKAKEELKKRYGRDDDKNTRKGTPPGPKPHGTDESADVGKPVGTNPIGSRPTTRAV